MCNKLWYVRMFGTFQSPYLGVIYYIIFSSRQFSMYTNISSSTIMFVESGVRSRHSHLQKGFLPSHFDVVWKLINIHNAGSEKGNPLYVYLINGGTLGACHPILHMTGCIFWRWRTCGDSLVFEHQLKIETFPICVVRTYRLHAKAYQTNNKKCITLIEPMSTSTMTCLWGIGL